MLESGTIVAGYRVDGVLGSGGMGTVYRATQLSLNRVVALKVLAQELSNDAGFRARFEREGQLQAGLDHQHIVAVFEAGRTDLGLFMAMRLIDGPTLKALIQSGELDPRRALRILAQVANALDEAHAAGLIHRDIKPQNVLIGRDDHTYLCDFGLIKSPDDSESLTGTGQFLGTIDYVSPEQIQGEVATSASDCYSLCAVLYECLTGQVPFPRASEAATLHAQIIEPPPKPTDTRPELPASIDDVIAAGMAKDPEQRPASAGELIRQAAAALAGVDLSGPQAGGSDEPIASVGVTKQAGVVRADTTRVPAAATAPASVPTPASAPAPAGKTTLSEPASADRPAGALRSRVLLLALAAVAIIAGVLVGHSGTKHKNATLPTTSSVAGPLRLRYPTAWQPVASIPSLPGTTFTSPIELSATVPVAGTLDAGVVTNASGPTLLPAGLRSAVTGTLPDGQPVTLAGFGALRYGPLRLRGVSGTITLYVTPIAGGVVTIACKAPTDAFAGQCGRVAATASLLGATALPLGPSAAYGHALATVLAQLRTAAGPALTALGAAGTHGAQSTAARRLASAYGTAADAVARLQVSPRDRDANAALSLAFQRLAAGYGRAATAAARVKSSDYAGAERQLSAAETALRQAVSSLSALGYHVATG